MIKRTPPPKQYRFCMDTLGIGKVLDYLFDHDRPLFERPADE